MGAISHDARIASVISWHYEHKARIKYRPMSLISEDADDDEEEFAEIYKGWTSTTT